MYLTIHKMHPESMQEKEDLKTRESKRIERQIFQMGVSTGALYVGLFHAFIVFPECLIVLSESVSHNSFVAFILIVNVMAVFFFVPLIYYGQKAYERLLAAWAPTRCSGFCLFLLS